MVCAPIKTVATRALAVAALAASGLWAWQALAARSAADPPAARREAKSPKPVQGADKAKPPPREKTFEVELRDKSWIEVFEWLSDISNLAVLAPYRPTGKVTFLSPKGKRKYTLAEIIDLLNDLLQKQKYLLVRRPHSFILCRVDEITHDDNHVHGPWLRPEDLGKRGRTELVYVMLPLTRLRARNLGPDVKKLLGPFGGVGVLESSNRLLLQDTAGNLRRICRLVKELEAQASEKKPREKSH